MADDSQAIDAAQAAPASDIVVEKPQELAPPAPAPEVETEQQQPVTDGLDELDFGFKKYPVTPELKQAVEALRASVTQKSQELSARSKELDNQRIQQSEASDAELDARANLRHVTRELDRFKTFDFAAYQVARQQDPMAADEAWNYRNDLFRQKEGLEQTIGTAQQERSQAQRGDLAKRLEETQQFARTNIKGWTPEIDVKMQEYAQSKGVSPAFIAANLSPTLYGILHEAWIGSQYLKSQTAKPQTPTAEAITPQVTVTPRSSPTSHRTLKEYADAGDMEGYAKARAAGRVR